MRWLPGRGGAVLGSTGQPTDLHQSVGVALTCAAGVGYAHAGGSRCGELFDQRPERGAVFGGR